MSPRLRLRIEPAIGEPSTRSIDADEIVVGRGSDTDLQIPDRFMSRRHTRFFRVGDELWVEGLGSRNGTLVNGRRIDAPTAVRPADVIGVSDSRLVVESADDEPAPAPSSATPSGTRLLKDPAAYLPKDPGTRAGEESSPLRHYADRLKVMNDVHEALSGSLSLDELRRTQSRSGGETGR